MGRILGGVALAIMGLMALVGFMYWGTFNSFQKKDEGVLGAERKIASCYQKRYDTFTNMEATVKQAAGNEKGILEEVTKARGSVGQIKIPENATPEQIRAFAEQQSAVGGALTRLLAVAEAYPTIQSNQNFVQLQKDLKEIEQQCNVLRNKYIQTVQSYNASVRSFPSNIVAGIHGYTKKEQLKFDDEARNKASPQLFKAK